MRFYVVQQDGMFFVVDPYDTWASALAHCPPAGLVMSESEVDKLADDGHMVYRYGNA